MLFTWEARDARRDVKAAVTHQRSQDSLRLYYAVGSKDQGMRFTSSNDKDKDYFLPRVVEKQGCGCSTVFRTNPFELSWITYLCV